MKIGCCTSLWEDLIFDLPAAGADYAEVSFSSLGEKSLAQVKERAQQLKSAGVAVESMNILFPGELRLTGPEADFSTVDRYLGENLPKAAALGVKVVVFGSGGSRRVPDGFSREQAFFQLTELCKEHIAPAMAAHGITCCVEPLNSKECNILNTSSECFQLVQAVNHSHFQLLVDLYHFDMEGESLSAISHYAGHLCHTHIASAKNNRCIPQPGDGEEYGAFFQALKDIGYSGRMSLEGAMPGGISQIAPSLAYLRQLAQDAGI